MITHVNNHVYQIFEAHFGNLDQIITDTNQYKAQIQHSTDMRI